MSHAFFAPGKVVVAGEYAVVDGAPALVAAVDIGVALEVLPGGPRHTTSPTGDTTFVDAALDAEGVTEGRWDFRDAGGPPLASKPGLGGSAAATVVAVHAARVLHGGDASPSAVCEAATEVHHRVQGSGSGIDVAASTWGGMLRFVRGERPTAVSPPRLVVIWSGASAKTGPRVERYRAWEGRDRFVRDSAALVDAFDRDPILVLREDRILLERMARQAGIAYRTPALDRIVALAASHGGAAKASGAGGGDCAVAVLPDEDAETAFVQACSQADLPVLSTAVAPGVGRA